MGELKSKPKRKSKLLPGQTRMGQDIIEGLKEVIRYFKGEPNNIKVTRIPLTPTLVALRQLIPARRALGLSRKDVATAVGVSVATIYRLEKGRTKNPTGNLLERYAKAVGLELTPGVKSTEPPRKKAGEKGK